MTYKNKLICLLIIIAVLSLIYAGSYIFRYNADNTRLASHIWIDSGAAAKINRFMLDSGREKLEFTKKGDQWFVAHNNNEYPARRLRVEDFLGIFSARAQWPVRSSSGAAYDRFGLGDGAARITLYENYSVLLDLLLGDDDILGRESYFRKAGQSEIRSGDSNIRAYLAGDVKSWYNLRLIPETSGGSISINNVQRLTVYSEWTSQVFARSARSWSISGINVVNPDIKNIEEYINFVLNAEGEDFIDSASEAALNLTDYNYSRITLEFGNGNVVTISMTEPDELNKRYAKVSNSGYIYQIPLWVTARLFREAESFESN